MNLRNKMDVVDGNDVKDLLTTHAENDDFDVSECEEKAITPIDSDVPFQSSIGGDIVKRMIEMMQRGGS